MTVYSSNLSGSLEPGESERFVVETRAHDAVKAAFSADGQPYEVDVQTGTELNFPSYTSVLPLGVQEFTDTNEHTLATDIADDAVYVEVTNTSNSTISLDGVINKHSENSDTTVGDFLTTGTGERGVAYLDGKLITNTELATISRLIDGIVSEEITSLEGNNLTISNGALALAADVGTAVGDGERFTFGDDDDYWIEYDAAQSRLEFGSSDVDGGGSDGVVFTIADGENVPGGLSEPTSANQFSRKGYVDGVAQGLSLKEEVAAATDGQNIDLASATDPNPVDGYTLSDGERVLLKDQTDATENGIYVASTATDPTTWTRAPDMDEDSEVETGVFCYVSNGTANVNKSFVITTNNPITLGATNISWSVFTTAGQLEAGNGLTKTGQTFAIATPGVDTDELFDDAVTVGKVLISDDSGLPFGTDDDITVRYDSGNDTQSWRDEANSADRMEMDRTSGDLSIEGQLTEGVNL